MQNPAWSDIVRQIQIAIGETFELKSCKSLSGGDINQAFQLEGTKGHYFVKLNRASCVDMFAAEAAGLSELARCCPLKIPRSILFGTSAQHSFLVLEWLDFAKASPLSSRQLGRGLAELHLHEQAYFGWSRDNTIGLTSQLNTPRPRWSDFWRQQRLGYQLQLAAERGYGGQLQRLGEQLSQSLDVFFNNYSPRPSLLHGDLWSGNAAVTVTGAAVIFDPACYYGDREADLAMTALFGGFSADFYAAYQERWPLDSGYSVRKDLYNLYHVLNHLNLFGVSYLSQAEHMMQCLLAEIK